MRTLLWLLLVAASSLVGGVAAVVVLAMAYPGVKGPNVTDEQVVMAFLVGCIVGGVIPVAIWRRRARVAEAAWARDRR